MTASWSRPGATLAAARLAEGEAAAGRGGDISILIADDHEVVREGLVAMIDRQPGMRAGTLRTSRAAVTNVLARGHAGRPSLSSE